MAQTVLTPPTGGRFGPQFSTQNTQFESPTTRSRFNQPTTVSPTEVPGEPVQTETSVPDAKIILSIQNNTPETINYKLEISPPTDNLMTLTYDKSMTVDTTIGGTYTQWASATNQWLTTEITKIRGLKHKNLFKAKITNNAIFIPVPLAIHNQFETFVAEFVENSPVAIGSRQFYKNPNYLQFINNSTSVETETQQPEIHQQYDVQFENVSAQYKNYDLQVNLQQFDQLPDGNYLRIEFERLAKGVVFYQPGPEVQKKDAIIPQTVKAAAATLDIPEIQTNEFNATDSQIPPIEGTVLDPETQQQMSRKRKRMYAANHLAYHKASRYILLLKGGLNAYTRMSQLLYYHPDFKNDSFQAATAEDFSARKQQLCVNGFIDSYAITNVNPITQIRKRRKLPVDKSTGLRQENVAKFMEKVSQYRINRMDANGQMQQYPPKNLQKNDIMWLFSQQSAIIGDETGGGKAMQLIIAADMRTKSDASDSIERTFGFSSKRILYITLPNVVQQTITSIQEIVGNDVQISTQPNSGAKWVVVSYSMLDDINPKTTQFVNMIRAQNFDVLILDESHTIKNQTTNTSKNVEALSANIPYKWMASATVSANKPIDLWFPLKLIGHPLGEMTKRMFGNTYTNTTVASDDENASTHDIVSIPSILQSIKMQIPNFNALSTEQKIDAASQVAEQLVRKTVNDQVKNVLDLKAMLLLTNVYKRKTKQNIRLDDTVTKAEEQAKAEGRPFDRNEYLKQNKEDILATLPKHTQNPDIVPVEAIGGANTIREIRNEVSKVQDPLHKQGLYRQLLALHKVPVTLQKITPILQQGKKVIVFSAYQKAAQQLRDMSNQILQQINPQWMCGYFMGDADKVTRQQDLDNFKNPQSPEKDFVREMVIGITAGGTGIDLPNIVDDVFVNDFPWTPKDADQAEGRAFRVNSDNDVTTHYVVVDNCPDKLFYQALVKKQKLANVVQNVDERYAEKVKNFQDTRPELQEAQQVYWNEVLRSIADAIRVEDYMSAQRFAAIKTNWLKKLSQNNQIEENLQYCY